MTSESESESESEQTHGMDINIAEDGGDSGSGPRCPPYCPWIVLGLKCHDPDHPPMRRNMQSDLALSSTNPSASDTRQSSVPTCNNALNLCPLLKLYLDLLVLIGPPVGSFAGTMWMVMCLRMRNHVEL